MRKQERRRSIAKNVLYRSVPAENNYTENDADAWWIVGKYKIKLTPVLWHDDATFFGLRSANRHLLDVPRFRLNPYGCQAFSVAGPMAWNSLPDFIRDNTNSTDCFRRLLTSYLFARYQCILRIRGTYSGVNASSRLGGTSLVSRLSACLTEANWWRLIAKWKRLEAERTEGNQYWSAISKST